MLLQGLDLTNSLFGVLIRFRQEIIALMADIESMFYWDTNRLRCLCCPEGDIEGPPFENQMKVHLLGASCAKFGPRKTASDHSEELSSEAVKRFRETFTWMIY